MSSIQNTNTGNPEWRTPLYITAKARTVMGSIDCDPATFPGAQKYIKAKKFYTKQSNGLASGVTWNGNVWLNPPYNTGSKSNPGINAFVDKLIKEINNGNCTQAIFLAQSKTDTQWFQKLFSRMYGVMFTRRRISFVDAVGTTQSNPGYGSVLMYYGPNLTKFHTYFNDVAYTVR